MYVKWRYSQQARTNSSTVKLLVWHLPCPRIERITVTPPCSHPCGYRCPIRRENTALKRWKQWASGLCKLIWAMNFVHLFILVSANVYMEARRWWRGGGWRRREGGMDVTFVSCSDLHPVLCFHLWSEATLQFYRSLLTSPTSSLWKDYKWCKEQVANAKGISDTWEV
jgi:hypothetical protein